MKLFYKKISIGMLFYLVLLTNTPVQGQQFNSDSWISKQHGTVTVIATYGQRNAMLMTTYSLIPRWEFTVAGYVYNDDDDLKTDDGYSTSFYAKYMFYENDSKTGGAAVKFGTGLDPGYLDGSDRVKDAFQSFWTNAPITIPFFDNTLSWDIMPGASVTRNYGEEETTIWYLTYSTRLAWYPVNPYYSIVGEIYGSAGELNDKSEFRVGLRWEPDQYTNIAITYDEEFGGNYGGGFEIGLMIFSPPFFCIGDCD
jgi:hypothetical protein